MTGKDKALAQKVISFIQKHNLFVPGDKLVVAVSGGADSVCLFHILVECRTSLGVELHVAHLNHQLRGNESDTDAEYVLGLACRLGVPATVVRWDVADYRAAKGLSLEEAAREVRYDFLAEVAREMNATKVVVGHTRDDRVETILLHLLRGTGVAGLSGLQPRSLLRCGEHGRHLEIVRPLLEVTRRETWDYCKEHELEPRIDSSNVEPVFLRNRIRLELLPLLKTYNPSVDAALLRLADIASDEASFIEEQVSLLWDRLASEEKGIVYLDKDELAALPQALQRQAFRFAVKRLRGDLKDIEADHIEAMIDFLSKPAGRRISLPQGLNLTVEYGRLALMSSQASVCPFPSIVGTFNINIPGETDLAGWRVRAEILKKPTDDGDDFAASLDLDKTGGKLMVRCRRPGDRFRPLGMSQTKKLQDFMVDSRIPRSWRDRVPLVCSPQQILWVVGWRIDDRVKVTETTRKVLHLKFERKA